LKRLSRNQELILKYLELKPEMTTKELAEIIFGRVLEYKSKEYSSVARSLKSLEGQKLVQRVQVKLRWRLKSKTIDTK
jgi:DNA-binding MarR family transcriptional regulator